MVEELIKYVGKLGTQWLLEKTPNNGTRQQLLLKTAAARSFLLQQVESIQN